MDGIRDTATAAAKYTESVASDSTTPGSALLLIAALKASATSRDLQTGQKLHTLYLSHSKTTTIYKHRHTSIANSLIHMYSSCRSMPDARLVFNQMPRPDTVSWNTLLFGYQRSGHSHLVLDLFQSMLSRGISPDARSYVAALKACASSADKDDRLDDQTRVKFPWLQAGMALHSQAAAAGFETDLFVASALVDMYAKCGSPGDAVRVFNRMVSRDVVSWNSILFGYVGCGDGNAAMELFSRMLREGDQPVSLTYVAVAKACAQGTGAARLERAMALHSQASKAGFDRDLMLASTLVDLYASCGALEDARRVFAGMERRDVVAWNAVIFGHAENGQPEVALELYSRMLREDRCKPTSVTFVAVLKACSSLAVLRTGTRVHSRVLSAGVESDPKLATSLVDFYAKCGKIVDAGLVFDSANTRTISTWNALVAGYTKQGETAQALELVERMLSERLRLDSVTMVSVLDLCSHTGMVDLGKKFFQAMSVDYAIVPELEHYTCMVDLLCRANRIEEALQVVEEMRVEPDAALWRTILSACRKWNNVRLGKLAFDSAMKLGDREASTYILMSDAC